MRLSLYNLTPWHFLDVDIDAPLLLWTASGHRMKVPALAQWKVMVVWWIGSLKRIVSFYLYSQILAKFVGTTCSMRLSNHSCCLIWHCHMIQLHIEFSILLKKQPYCFDIFSFTFSVLCNETEVLTMGMFFGSGPTPSPTSIPLGLPSLEDVFSGDFRVGLPYRKIHFLYQLVSKYQNFI